MIYRSTNRVIIHPTFQVVPLFGLGRCAEPRDAGIRDGGSRFAVHTLQPRRHSEYPPSTTIGTKLDSSNRSSSACPN